MIYRGNQIIFRRLPRITASFVPHRNASGSTFPHYRNIFTTERRNLEILWVRVPLPSVDIRHDWNVNLLLILLIFFEFCFYFYQSVLSSFSKWYSAGIPPNNTGTRSKLFFPQNISGGSWSTKLGRCKWLGKT